MAKKLRVNTYNAQYAKWMAVYQVWLVNYSEVK